MNESSMYYGNIRILATKTFVVWNLSISYYTGKEGEKKVKIQNQNWVLEKTKVSFSENFIRKCVTYQNLRTK